MLSAILIAAAPFILNMAMALAKSLGAAEFQTPGKRFVLAILAVVGVIIGNAIMGTEINPNEITAWVTIISESAAAFIAAHGSYTLFWKKEDPEMETYVQ